MKYRMCVSVRVSILRCVSGCLCASQLHVQSVQRILKGVYWLLKRFPNVREVAMADPDDNLIVRTHLGWTYREREMHLKKYIYVDIDITCRYV